jgi:hypothetical protein
MSKPELESMRHVIGSQVEEAVVKGHGAASFLFAKHGCRSVEISAHQEGGWWLEFWEAKTDEDASPAQETRVDTTNDAIEAAIRWLT